MKNSKKKVLIVNNNLDTGGIQKSLINLLKELDRIDKYEVDLFIFSKTGQYKDFIPQSINVIDGNKFTKLLAISQNDSKKMGYNWYVIRLISVLFTKLINRKLPTKLLLSTQKKLEGYDVALSFSHDPNKHTFYGGCNDFVIDRVKSKKKCSFVHCDYLNYGGADSINNKNYYRFDKIATVSESCKKNFLVVNPDLKERVFCVPNCKDYETIINESNKNSIVYNEDKFNIVSVARLNKEKGFERALNALEKVIVKNNSIIWHIIGDGPLNDEIRATIKSKGLQNNVFMYGGKSNPYKYMKNADLLLLPSIHEAAPVVFDEAKCIGIPILTTDTISAKELVEDCRCGWVCDNSEEGIIHHLEYIINNRNQVDFLKAKLKKMKYNNEDEIEAFCNLLED